jgi:heme-degrading monooxygenase HmoA
MAYVRISYVTPKSGQEGQVEDLLSRLSQFYVSMGGYISGYHLRPHAGDERRRMGRVGIWESEEHAVHAAQTERALALRSELLRLVDEDSHEELSFIGEPDR